MRVKHETQTGNVSPHDSLTLDSEYFPPLLAVMSHIVLNTCEHRSSAQPRGAKTTGC